MKNRAYKVVYGAGPPGHNFSGDKSQPFLVEVLKVRFLARGGYIV